MKPASILCLTATVLVTTLSLHAQVQTPPPATMPAGFEQLPTLNASAILQPQYLQGTNFTVRNPVPTYSGSNRYTIDSDFGVFEADGNAMLVRRVAEINAIGKLKAMSGTKEFMDAAKQAATVPLHVAQDLVTQPVQTIASVPKGIWGMLNRVGSSVTEAVDGRRPTEAEGNVVENVSGFSKSKRDLALKLGVDPYSTNEVFQKELNKVAWPAFLGKFTVNIGLGAISGGVGTAFSAMDWNNSLTDALRDKSPVDLRSMNRDLLTNNMGVSSAVADAYLNNTAISPTTQTITVAALGQLGNIPGQGEFIRAAATSQSEHDALAYQQSVQIMAHVNQTAPIARISHLKGLPICQTNDGTVMIPIQWDYIAWTAMVEGFIAALKAEKFATPATGYTVVITGVASPKATEALAQSGVNLKTKALPGPLQ